MNKTLIGKCLTWTAAVITTIGATSAAAGAVSYLLFRPWLGWGNATAGTGKYIVYAICCQLVSLYCVRHATRSPRSTTTDGN